MSDLPIGVIVMRNHTMLNAIAPGITDEISRLKKVEKSAAVVAAYFAQFISEGEAAQTLGIGRIEFRELADELRDAGRAAWEESEAHKRILAEREKLRAESAHD